MIRLGLCCQFLDSPIRFRTATHRYVATLDRAGRQAYLADIAGHNAGALVVRSAVQELELQAEVAELVGADVIVLHAGGAGGGIPAAVERLERGLDRLTPRARERLALENDDRCFTPLSLGPLCERTGVLLVYDAHHHRCLPDGLPMAEASELAFGTWRGREPDAYVSSPRDGWQSPNPRPHADYIDPADFPDAWRGRMMTIDVEAKAKERAVLALKDTVDA